MAAGEPSWPQLTTGQWNLAAENVTTGTIDLLKSQYKFWVTVKPYDVGGVVAPLPAVKEKSPAMFQMETQDKINSSVAINIYIWIESISDPAGTVVDNSIQVLS